MTLAIRLFSLGVNSGITNDLLRCCQWLSLNTAEFPELEHSRTGRRKTCFHLRVLKFSSCTCCFGRSDKCKAFKVKSLFYGASLNDNT